MSSLLETGEQLCKCIASLDTKLCLDDVSEALDPVLERRETDEVKVVDNGGVTPLMVACDKNIACIEWILKRKSDDPSLIFLLGSPLDQAESGNTAMHYAANVDFDDSISLLRDMMDKEEQRPVMKLASLRNDNYDTPVMIAAMKGHVAFLQQIKRLLLLETEDIGPSSEVKGLFELVNDDGDTALSLACGHGHVEVVNFLLQEAGVTVTYEYVKEAEKTLKQIDDALKLSPTLSDQHRGRRNDVNKCIVILKVALDKSAQAIMEQLLAEEDEEKPQKKEASSVKKKKSRRKAKRTELPNNKKSTSGDSSAPDTRTSIFRDSDAGNPTEPTDISSLPTEPRKNSFDKDLDVDAIIEALCLDASMLLLGPREMALKLSPCQLDAIAAVLRNQIQAVKEARVIQARLRDQPSQIA